ncbi:porin family protein [uncultured Pontibacter sp.]|uniref:porin family protein n=1 Tax=uncultured Pontibacter sp. TaxID=453356 RepID=UPI002625CFDA|nr:porin family protein [uncultured Pontibacter sp.]
MRLLILLTLILYPISWAHSQTLFGVRGGYNYSKINGIGSSTYKYSWNEGYHLGLYAYKEIGENLFIIPEVNFTTRGYNYERKYSSNKSLSGDTLQLNQSADIHYLDVPILAQLQLGRLFLEVGPQFGFYLSGSIKNDFLIEQNGEQSHSYSSKSMEHLVQPVDVGLITGIGYRMNNGLGLGLRYNQGFREVIRRKNWEKNIQLQATVSYTIGYASFANLQNKKRGSMMDEYYNENMRPSEPEKNTRGYKVITKQNITRYSIVKVGESPRTDVQFVFNSIGASSPQNIILAGSSGAEVQTAMFTGFRDIEVPFQGSIRYSVRASLGVGTIESFLEYEITEPGIWKITILSQ